MKFERFVEICMIVLKERFVNSTTAAKYQIDYNTFKKALNILEKLGFVERTNGGWFAKP